MKDDTIITMRYIESEEGNGGVNAVPESRIENLAEAHASFKIRLADTDAGRSSVSMLIQKMYSWRGYAGNHDIHSNPNRITLAASNQAGVIGTLTVSVDSPIGILADEVFKDQIDMHRDQGGKVCELIKFAFDPDIRSKRIMAALFHIAFIYARHIHKCSDLFIEVNPRHRRFYERMLGFEQQGDKKNNLRVNAPSFLLRLDLQHAQDQIRLFGGTSGCSSHAGSERSLYSYFYSLREEEGITNRLLQLG